MNPNPTPSGPPLSESGRNAALDGLRGVAIAMVLWHHFIELHLPPGRQSWLGWLRAGTGLSWSGVDLFFTLSGFFIGGILIDQRASERLARVFYMRRALRILPLYFVTLTAIAIALEFHAAGSFHEFPAWVYGFFLTNIALASLGTWDWLPLSILWSLAVEEQFYLIAPWLVRFVREPRIPWFAVGLAVLAEAGRVCAVCLIPGTHLFLHVLTPFRMDALAAGILAAWIVRHPASYPSLSKYVPKAAFAAVVGASLLVVSHPSEGSQSMALYGYLILASGFGLLVTIIAQSKYPRMNRILDNPFLVHLGRHSYFIYLWHALIGGFIFQWWAGSSFTLDNVRGAAIVAIAVGATWLAATVSWKWFEGPLVRLGKRFSY